MEGLTAECDILTVLALQAKAERDSLIKFKCVLNVDAETQDCSLDVVVSVIRSFSYGIWTGRLEIILPRSGLARHRRR